MHIDVGMRYLANTGSYSGFFSVSAAVLLLSACASPPAPKDPGHSRPLSVQEHMEEAHRHEREAKAHSDLSTPAPESADGVPIQCFDQPLAGIPYSGGKPLRIMRPCWTVHSTTAGYHGKYAEVHLQAAAEHRTQAAS